MDDIRQIVRDRLDEEGLAPATVSRAATGKPDLIRKFLKEHTTPRADRLRALCRALDLEFYVGPKRPTITSELDEKKPLDVERLCVAIEAVEDGLRDLDTQLDIRKKAKVVTLAYQILEDSDGAHAISVARIIELAA